MGAILSTLSSVYFGCLMIPLLVVAMLPIYFLKILPISREQRAGYSLMLLQFVWRVSLLLTPWVRRRPQFGYASQMREFGEAVRARGAREEGARPVMLLSNHTSFFDTILIATEIPAGSAYYSRTYMSEKLFRLPVFGTICAACDQFSVDFGGKKGFKVDKEKMKVTQRLVDKHLAGGGLLSFFPEGEMNPSPSKLMLVRYGGMKKALEFDAKIYIFLTCGCPTMWPRKTLMGGRPSTINYSIHCLAPNGAKALASELLENSDDKSKPDYVLLAEHVRSEMQSVLDSLHQLEKKDQ